MPQYDRYHYIVKTALIKDGWTITDDPFTIEFKGLRLYADLWAEKVIAAQRSNRKIVIEIKVFNSPSPVTELEKAIGQYNIYRTLLKRVAPERVLYLAIAEDTYQDFFQRPAIEVIISDQAIKLVIFKQNTEEIIQWIS